MAVLKMTGALLGVLGMIKKKQALLIVQSELGLCDDWPKELRKFIFALPKSVFHDVGLKRNEQCIREIERFSIPIEWTTSEDHRLSFYRFAF